MSKNSTEVLFGKGRHGDAATIATRRPQRTTNPTPSTKRTLPLKQGKPLQPWNPSTSPETKHKSMIPSSKVQPKVRSICNSATRIASELSLVSSVKDAKERNKLRSRVCDATASSGSPTKKQTYSLARTIASQRLRVVSSLGKIDNRPSSLLKGSSLRLSPPLKTSAPSSLLLSNHTGGDITPICSDKTPDFETANSAIDVRFITPSSSNQQVAEELAVELERLDLEANLRLARAREVEAALEDRHNYLERNRVEETLYPPMRTTVLPPTDAKPSEGEDKAPLPAESTYPNPEAHILAIDPNITRHTPRSRRSTTVSDPVHSTVPTHEESLRYQAGLYIANVTNARMMLIEDDAFKLMPKSVSPHFGCAGSQDVEGISQLNNHESAYQTMLKKAHFKPEQTSRPQLHHEKMRQHNTIGSEKVVFHPSTTMKPHTPKKPPEVLLKASATPERRYLQPSNQNTLWKKVPNLEKPTSDDRPGGIGIGNNSIPRTVRVPLRPSPKCRLVRDPFALEKSVSPRPGVTFNSRNGLSPDWKQQQGQPVEPRSSRLITTNNIAPGNKPFGVRSYHPPQSPDRGGGTALRKSHGMQNKSVESDSAITILGPVIRPTNKQSTAEVMFKRLFKRETENEEEEETPNGTADDLGMDALVATFKKWKKGDSNKLECLLKALRDIESDAETDSTIEEKFKGNRQKEVWKQKANSGFDPRVPDFNPSTFKENEIYVRKIRSHKTATPAPSAARPPAPVTLNVPVRTRPQVQVAQPLPNGFEKVVGTYHPRLRTDLQLSSETDAQPVKKRVIWDDPDDAGREAVMLSHRFAAEYLEGFLKKYPLTGQKAAVVPKKRLEDLPMARQSSNAQEVAKMTSEAADIQQKLELLLLKKKEAKIMSTR